MSLPSGWYEEKPDPPAVYQAHKTFDDGTDVIVTIVQQPTGVYEVRSSAESRTSGPSDASHGVAKTIESARSILEAEAAGWDRDRSWLGKSSYDRSKHEAISIASKAKAFISGADRSLEKAGEIEALLSSLFGGDDDEIDDIVLTLARYSPGGAGYEAPGLLARENEMIAALDRLLKLLGRRGLL